MLLAKRNSDVFPNLLDNFFGNSWDSVWGPVRHTSSYKPAVNISESDAEYGIEIAVPGADKKDFKVEVNNGVLTISAEKKSDKESKEDNYTRREFYYESFSRSFELPEGKVNDGKISANYENGILHIAIPKSEEAKVKPTREIKIV